jgi:hypothetical protein
VDTALFDLSLIMKRHKVIIHIARIVAFVNVKRFQQNDRVSPSMVVNASRTDKSNSGI